MRLVSGSSAKGTDCDLHHLCKGDEEDNGTESVGEEPEPIKDGRPSRVVRSRDGTEEEGRSDVCLSQEVGSECSDPVEDCETSSRSEDEHG